MRKMTAVIVVVKTILYLFASCTSKVQEVNDLQGYDTTIGRKYAVDLKERYKQYSIVTDSQVKVPIEFIEMYITKCGQDSSKTKGGYSIVNTCNAFGMVNGKEESLFYSELVYFKDVGYMDSTIAKIKNNNCIDLYNLKLSRIYKVGSNTALFTNFYPTFDVADFEVFLMREFNNALSIEVVNTYQ